MKPNWVLPEGQRRKRNNSNGFESTSLPGQAPNLELTTEDAILIGQMINATNMITMDKLAKGK